MMVTDKKVEENLQVGRYFCEVHSSGVGISSIQCTVCDRLCDKRCPGLRSLNGVVDFYSSACEVVER